VERERMRSVRTVIIGNGIAGFFAARTLRDLDPKRPITLLTHENELFYSRPLITQYLTGEMSRDDLTLSSQLFYQEKGIDLLKGVKVIKVDFKNQKLHLHNQKKIAYDQLLLATGGLPRSLEKVRRTRGIYFLRTLADAEGMREVVKKSKNALVAGGGLVGIKIAHALHQIGLKTTIIVSSPHLFSRSLDAKAARIFQSHLEEKGIRFFFNDEVTEVMERTSSKDQIWGVVTRQKRKIQGDFVVIGKGVRPNVDLFEGTSLLLKEGIAVNRQMKTNLKNVFAAGDAVEAPELLTGKGRLISIWPNASEQGKIAAFNMAGERRQYAGGLPMNAFELYGLSAITMGLIQPSAGEDYEERIYESPDQKVYQKFVLKGDRIVGAIFLQQIQNAGVVLEALKKGANVEAIKEKMIKRSSLPERPFVPMEVLY
jgi:NAD(P)H-nitrite reductase large subunit